MLRNLDFIDPYKKKMQLAGFLQFLDTDTPPSNAEIEIISLNITSGSTIFTFGGVDGYRTKTSHKRLYGLALSISDPQAIEGSTFQLAIDDKIYFDEGSQSALLTFNLSCPPDQRFQKFVNKAINQSEIKIRFKSSNVFTNPYSVKLYLLVQ